MLVPNTFDKLSLKSKRCNQCSKYVIESKNDMQAPHAFSSLLIHYVPKIYFILCRSFDETTGDVFLEIVNSTETDMYMIIDTYPKEKLGSRVNAEIKPIDGTILLEPKHHTADKLFLIGDINEYKNKPKIEKSLLIKRKNNIAIVQLVFQKARGQTGIIVNFGNKFLVPYFDENTNIKWFRERSI